MKRANIIKLIGCVLLAVVVIIIDAFVLLVYNGKSNSGEALFKSRYIEELSLIDLKGNANNYSLKYNEIDGANKYVIEILNKDDLVISNTSTVNTMDVSVPLDKLYNGEKYYINLKAYNGEVLLRENTEDEYFIWNEPSFSKDNKKEINNDACTIKIDGSLDGNYRLVIMNKGDTLYEGEIDTNTFELPINIYKNKSIDLNLMLYKDQVLVSSYTIKNNYVKPTTTTVPNPIKALKVTSPGSYVALTEPKDINIAFTGGEGATNKYLTIYEDNKAIKKEELKENTYLISADTFKDDKSYRVLIEATDGKFKREAEVYISTIKNGAQRMVDLAKTQLGVKQGIKYAKWYGFNGRIEWCAVFISWLANELGYLKSVIPKFANVGVGWRWFESRGLTKKPKNYVPKTGDIIFFDFDCNNRIDHVGIVDHADGKYVYTVEGNSGDECKSKKYKINYSGIHGYATPRY